MTDTYKVIQADRSASAELARKVYGNRIASDIADGTIEHHHFLEAFAKHREDTEALIVGWLRAIARLSLTQATGASGKTKAEGAATLRILADAIARGDHYTNNTPGD
jgi:hypothetical protein